MVNNKEKQVNLLLELLSANIGQVSSSIILKRIEKLSDNFHGRNNHSSHCQFDRDGGGHGNITAIKLRKSDELYYKIR
ncbi:hypothetical protein [Wolbachia endosymbiont (group B) of Longitarsus flavicornis]|uniref:hypothetical protein n=1 Tax=Wolbachia endosymbiont (group B) of Longitarsus flavicornis TaxID=3066135 RepID=UPI003340A1B4